MMTGLLGGLIVLVFAEHAFGWGLATHMELAESLLSQAVLLGSGIGVILLGRSKDFILGNLLADVIIGKKLSSRRWKAHHWNAGWRLLENGHDDRTRALAYGFLSHLAADTVAHNGFVPTQISRAGSTLSLGHLYWELRADQYADPAHRKNIQRMLKNFPGIHEKLLTDHLYPELMWFGFNRRVFVHLNHWTNGTKFHRAMKVCQEVSPWVLPIDELNQYKAQALDRMADVLINGRKSTVLHEDPNGRKVLSDLRNSRRGKRSIILR